MNSSNLSSTLILITDRGKWPRCSDMQFECCRQNYLRQTCGHSLWIPGPLPLSIISFISSIVFINLNGSINDYNNYVIFNLTVCGSPATDSKDDAVLSGHGEDVHKARSSECGTVLVATAQSPHSAVHSPGHVRQARGERRDPERRAEHHVEWEVRVLVHS